MKTEVLAEGQSKVIHLRSLPDDVTPAEICNLAMPFKKYGSVKDFLQLKVNINILPIYINIIYDDSTEKRYLSLLCT